MDQYRGRTALVTGASSGIGEEFAIQLALLGADVILVARSEPKLKDLCEKVSTEYGVKAQYIAIDLSLDGSGSRLLEETDRRGARVDLLINNAGFGVSGEFASQSIERQLQMIHLNVISL